MKKIILTALALFMSVNSYAQIRVYDPSTGQEKDLNYLVKTGAVNKEKADALPPQKEKTMTKEDLIKMMNRIPDSNKPIDQRKITGLGTLLVFTEMKGVDKSFSKFLNSVGEVDGIKKLFFLKQPKSGASFLSMAVQTEGELKQKLKVDNNNKNARRMHVNSYPVMIYIAPDGSKSRYSASSGGLTALKIRLGEIKTILEDQNKLTEVEDWD